MAKIFPSSRLLRERNGNEKNTQSEKQDKCCRILEKQMKIAKD